MRSKNQESRIKEDGNKIINFLFEAATLKRLKRTGWQILGGNEESIAEHSYMVCVIGFLLAEKMKADKEKVLTMALFHDFPETRTGDVYKLADLYVGVDEVKAIQDGIGVLGDAGKGIAHLLREYRENSTLEAKIVHDADALALCLELKTMIERGNNHASAWLEANIKRLKLPESKELGREIEKSDSQEWWKKEREQLHKSMG